MKRILLAGAAIVGLTVASAVLSVARAADAARAPTPAVGAVEFVASLQITPGNVTASRTGRMFASVHGMRRGGGAQLVEIFPGDNQYRPFPNAAWNAAPGSGPDVLNTAHGVAIDSRDRLWVIDHGNWMPGGAAPAAPKLVAFDINTGETVFRHDFPAGMFPRGQILQDLAVDAERGFVYVADCGAEPGIVVVDLNGNSSRRLIGHPSFASEASDTVRLVVEGKPLVFPQPGGGFAPANVPINPITLSADGETLFWSAMVGTTMYAAPAAPFREGRSIEEIGPRIRDVGKKPVSDGIATDRDGNHFITNLGDNAIDILRPDGRLERLVSDPRFIWPDNVRFGPDSWLYVAINQLNRASIFTGGADTGQAPYHIARVWTGTPGQPGR